MKLAIDEIFAVGVIVLMLALLITAFSTHDAAPCPKYQVASIHKCDSAACEVLYTNGLKGKVKLPVELGQVVEVCP